MLITWGIALKPEALSVVDIHESQEVLRNLYSTTSLSNLPVLLGFFGKAAILVALTDVFWVLFRVSIVILRFAAKD